MQIPVPQQLESLSRLIARLYGAVRGERGNPTRLWREIVTGKWVLTPNRRPWSDHEADHIGKLLERFQECEIKEQAFRLTYPDQETHEGKGLCLKPYTVRYGRVMVHEYRYYLDAWTEEVSDKASLPELRHNHCFRLDKIASIEPINDRWRFGFDTVRVKFQLTGELASRYEARPGDRIQEATFEDKPIKLVCRDINNVFWFEHEILPYGSECIVLEPEPVRQRMQAIIQAMQQNYQE